MVFIFVAFCLSTFAMACAFPLVPQVVTALCGGDLSRASLSLGLLSACTPLPPHRTRGGRGWWSGLTQTTNAPANALATLLTVPVLGLLSDHVGRKPVFVLSLVRPRSGPRACAACVCGMRVRVRVRVRCAVS